MAKDGEKVLGMAINSLVRTNCEDEVNELVKYCLEMSKVSVDGSFKYLEEDIRPRVGEVLTRSTMIDIMKSVEHIEDVATIEKVCGKSESFRKAKNFMKVSNPKFFDESRSKKREAERLYEEKMKMIYDMRKVYSETLKQKEKSINAIYEDDDYLKYSNILDSYKKYGK